jgi:aspartyl-tRNA(Asn)/glutamyl-tRNA(Gln) amidotransferase subunit B
MQWETVIGLEVHVQLATRSKIFSGASRRLALSQTPSLCGGSGPTRRAASA